MHDNAANGAVSTRGGAMARQLVLAVACTACCLAPGARAHSPRNLAGVTCDAARPEAAPIASSWLG